MLIASRGSKLGRMAVAFVLGASCLAPVPVALARGSRAHAARSQRVRDEGHLRYLSDTASSIVDQGSLSGTLKGWGRVSFAYDGSPNVNATFAIHTVGGTIYGSARCRLHNPANPAPSFRGGLRISGGSGRYAHAHGSGELFGVFYRRGYGLVVQAIGTLRY